MHKGGSSSLPRPWGGMARGNFGHRRPARGWGRGRSRGRGFASPRPFKGQARDAAVLPHAQPDSQVATLDRPQEAEVGVIEYMNQCQGFTAVIKARFSDFHVNEIGLDGRMAQLTQLEPPVEPLPPEEEDEEVCSRYRIEHLPIETWDKLHELAQKTGIDRTQIEVDVSSLSKEERTKIHQSVKTVFGQKIVGTTVTKDSKKLVIFKKFNKCDKIDQRIEWPSTRGGEYVHFVLYKEHIDTMQASLSLAESLCMRPAQFAYAGVKDRRAKTTQWFSSKRLEPAKIIEAVKRVKNVRVGNFEYRKDTLRLGQLAGNRFKIALRNVTVADEVVAAAVEKLEENGFINYYGLQRFGNSREVPTYKIGLALMKGEWKKAIDMILQPRKFERDVYVSAAKKVYHDTGDANEGLKALGKKKNKSIEGKLLGGLSRSGPNDFVNALEMVPRNMRLLYIHSFQSLVWNRMVSRRIKEFGPRPIVGDLVLESGEVEESSELDSFRQPSLPFLDDYIVEETEYANISNSMTRQKVRVLKEEDLEKYTIYDIVLPVPGYDIIYPENDVKKYYKEFLEENGLTLEMPKQRVKTYSLSGAYRKIVGRIENVSWKIMHYDDPQESLIRSDLEELWGQPEPQDKPGGKYTALVINFSLSSSCYATMALRELLKIDTSVSAHVKLNDYHQSEKKDNPAEGAPDAKKIKLDDGDSTGENGKCLTANEEVSKEMGTEEKTEFKGDEKVEELKVDEEMKVEEEIKVNDELEFNEKVKVEELEINEELKAKDGKMDEDAENDIAANQIN